MKVEKWVFLLPSLHLEDGQKSKGKLPSKAKGAQAYNELKQDAAASRSR